MYKTLLATFVTDPGHCQNSHIQIIFQLRAFHKHSLYFPIFLQVTFISVEINEADF